MNSSQGQGSKAWNTNILEAHGALWSLELKGNEDCGLVHTWRIIWHLKKCL